MVVLGGVFGGGVALGAALGGPHFGVGMHQGQLGRHGPFGGQRFGDNGGQQRPGNGTDQNGQQNDDDQQNGDSD